MKSGSKGGGVGGVGGGLSYCFVDAKISLPEIRVQASQSLSMFLCVLLL